LLTITRVYDYGPDILATQDINKDGVNELIVDLLTCHYCTGILVYEWNGQSFKSLVRDWYIDDQANKLAYFEVANLDGYTKASIKDIDNNGTYELILDGGIPSYFGAMTGHEGPWRGQKVAYMWDGHYYVWYSQEYSPPNFRFEAIQDGDIQTERGKFESAISSYQAAIFDDELKSWTQDAWKELLRQNEEAQSSAYPDVKKCLLIKLNMISYQHMLVIEL